MTCITSVVIRCAQWHVVNTDAGEYWLQHGGKEPKPKPLRYPEDLSADEVAIVRAAWNIANAEQEDRRRSNLVAYEGLKAEQKLKRRQWSEGCAWIRHSVWHVESDHIWRITGKGTQILKFSELTNEEIAEVVMAKEREVQNRGMGGLLRRINRRFNTGEKE